MPGPGSASEAPGRALPASAGEPIGSLVSSCARRATGAVYLSSVVMPGDRDGGLFMPRVVSAPVTRMRPGDTIAAVSLSHPIPTEPII